MAKKILLMQTLNIKRQLLYQDVVQTAEITEDSVVMGEVLHIEGTILIPPLPNTPTETFQALLIAAIEAIGSEPDKKKSKNKLSKTRVN
jgi:hypothetical protein